MPSSEAAKKTGLSGALSNNVIIAPKRFPGHGQGYELQVWSRANVFLFMSKTKKFEFAKKAELSGALSNNMIIVTKRFPRRGHEYELRAWSRANVFLFVQNKKF
ncbi:hypothetical protein TB2_019352 [Malus domestica]